MIATFLITNRTVADAKHITADNVTQWVARPEITQFVTDFQRLPGEIWVLYVDCSDEFMNLVIEGLI